MRIQRSGGEEGMYVGQGRRGVTREEHQVDTSGRGAAGAEAEEGGASKQGGSTVVI